MTVKEFKNTDLCKKAKKITYYDLKDVDISNKLPSILNLLDVIATSNNSDGSIDVYTSYIE